ncbi:hypothetical protein [Actinomyces sp.]|uniref:hypothetical protein n=1 Tax=Actinomyces sp. TaxID=29317 RepID=UPI0034C5BB3B
MPDPHSLTGTLFDSPVPPGTSWPEDPADANTPVARHPAEVRRLAVDADPADMLDAILAAAKEAAGL